MEKLEQKYLGLGPNVLSQFTTREHNEIVKSVTSQFLTLLAPLRENGNQKKAKSIKTKLKIIQQAFASKMCFLLQAPRTNNKIKTKNF